MYKDRWYDNDTSDIIYRCYSELCIASVVDSCDQPSVAKLLPSSMHKKKKIVDDHIKCSVGSGSVIG
jgi:hypothetical protein